MQKSNTLIILDWDDTLFPTSWVGINNINIREKKTRDNYQVMFAELDNILYNFLTKCINLGKVLIMTNASYGWINITTKMVPNTSKLINKYIKVISARESYSEYYDINKWKHYAFEDEVINYFKNKKTTHNILSIGDALYEYEALIKIYELKKVKPKKRILKTIKLMYSPTYYSLIDQINVLSECINKLSHKKKHIDLNFEKLSN